MKLLILSALLVISLLRPAECQLGGLTGAVGGLGGAGAVPGGLPAALPAGPAPSGLVNLDPSQLSQIVNKLGVNDKILQDVVGLVQLNASNEDKIALLKNYAANNKIDPAVLKPILEQVTAALVAKGLPLGGLTGALGGLGGTGAVPGGLTGALPKLL